MDFQFRRRPSQLHIDLDAIVANYRALRRHIAEKRAEGREKPETQLMAVIKADAYGHGLVPVAQALASAGVAGFGVALLEEGIRLRQNGIEHPILVMGGLVGEQVGHFLDYHLDLTASSPFKLAMISEAARSRGITARVQIKIDTGMNRIGVRPSNAHTFIADALADPHIDVVGIYTHFAAADARDPAQTERQRSAFEALMDRVAGLGHELPSLHLCNTAGLLAHPAAHADIVRPGIGLFGVAPARDFAYRGRPAMSLRTEVVYVKGLRKGWGVGYGHSWQAPEDGWLATIPIGYGDGYPRRVSNRGYVLIGGHRRAIVGNISMDQTTLWLGRDRCEIGDEVVLIGQQGEDAITAWDVADWADTIAYEILCGWAQRLPRKYIGGPTPAYRPQ